MDVLRPGGLAINNNERFGPPWGRGLHDSTNSRQCGEERALVKRGGACDRLVCNKV